MSGGVKNGLYIGFDGGEGAGKTLQTHRLSKRLAALGLPVHATREPGSTPLYIEIRSLLLGLHDIDIPPLAEFLLFSAGRAEFMEKEIVPILESGRIVLSDRGPISSYAYQCSGKGVDFEFAQQVTEVVTQGIKPDLTLIFSVDFEVGLARRLGRDVVDRMELMSHDFHRRVNSFFTEYAIEHNLPIIDANGTVDEVEEAIWQHVLPVVAAKYEGVVSQSGVS